jgi:hypothetical protein
VNIGGLARSDAAGGFETEFAGLAAEIRDSHGGAQLAGPAGRPGDYLGGDQAAVLDDDDQAAVSDDGDQAAVSDDDLPASARTETESARGSAEGE